MPRGPRLDAPGAAHHVMLRGIERSVLFRDEDDYEEFLARLEKLVLELGLICFAWVLMPNHIHLVLRSGVVGISRLMARLGTSYALYFNQKYDRVGHLFQNRFRSRRIRDDQDLIGVIRYVHRNPLEARLASPAKLPGYRWCGHGALVGSQPPRGFHAISESLALVDPDPLAARAAIARWVEAPGADVMTPLEPAWLRSRSNPNRAIEAAFAALLAASCSDQQVKPEVVLSSARSLKLAEVRRAVAAKAVRELGMSGADVARRLHVSRAAVTKMLAVGDETSKGSLSSS